MFFGSSVDNLTILIMISSMTQGDLKQKDLVSKLVCFCVDGVSTFQGFRLRMIVQIQRQYAPFVVSVHCMAHQTNLLI
jgi:hypothetical protein